MKRFTHHLALTLVLGISLHVAAFAAGPYGNYYVKATATGTGDGSSWTNAFTDLQAAIDAAVPGDLICVAAGTYLPTRRHMGDSLRNSTFYIHKDITLLGGFSGEPGTEGSMDGRDPAVHVTILSGDLGVVGDTIDNAFHVVYIDHVSDTMRLDGFVIRDGNGFGGTAFEGLGAGIFNSGEAGRSNPFIYQCIIRDNHSSESGGGMFNYAQNAGITDPTLMNCRFLNNQASGGGGMTNLTDLGGSASPDLINCVFQGNVARTAQGSAISNIGHSATTTTRMINCIVTGNHGPTASAFESFVTGTGVAQPEFINCVFAGNSTGSIRVADIGTGGSNVTIRNSILWGNPSSHGFTTNGIATDVTYSIAQFGLNGEGNTSLDPFFVENPFGTQAPHTLGDVHVQEGSPAIDAGNNLAVPIGIFTDAEGHSRFVNSTGLPVATVDIGAYEFQGMISAIDGIAAFPSLAIFPNPVHDKLTISMTSSTSDVECILHDANGRPVTQTLLPVGQTRAEMDVNALAAGVYWLLCQNKKGDATLQPVVIY